MLGVVVVIVGEGQHVVEGKRPNQGNWIGNLASLNAKGEGWREKKGR